MMGVTQLLQNLPWRKRHKVDTDGENSEAIALNSPDCVVQDNVFIYSDENMYSQWMRKATERQADPKLYLYRVWKEDSQNVHLLKCIVDDDSIEFDNILLKMSADEINNFCISGQTLLHILCFFKDYTKLEMVLNKHVQMNAFNIAGLTPLHLAVQKHWEDGVKLLLTFGAFADLLPDKNCEQPNYVHEKAILTAARNGDNKITLNLYDPTKNVNPIDSLDNTLLHLACYSQCLPLVKDLLDKKTFQDSIHKVNKRGESPLHTLFAAHYNLNETDNRILNIAKLLLRIGANPNVQNMSGKTPLFLASRAGLPTLVNLLLKSGSDPTITANGNKSVLHAACRSGRQEVLDMLLNTGEMKIFITQEDSTGLAPFHVAVNSSSIGCCLLLLSYGDHLTNMDSEGRTRFQFAIHNMTNGNEMLRKCFDSKIEISSKNYDETKFDVEMNFSVLLSKAEEEIQYSIISDFDTDKAEMLLEHPLVESFLYLKWNKIKAFFYIHVTLYSIFLLVHTFYVVKTFCMLTDWSKEIYMFLVLYNLHIILLCFLSIFEILYVVANIRKYAQQYETYFNLTALLTSALVVFSESYGLTNQQIIRDIASIAIFTSWIKFMMMLGRFPSLGIYVLMFTRVSKSVISFLLPFSSLLLAFTFAFSVLFNNVATFQSIPIALVKIVMMMLGEIDYGDIYEDTLSAPLQTRIIGHIFLVVFVFLIPILLANLLIGLAVNDLPDLQKHGNIRRLVKQASYLVSYERVSGLFRCLFCWQYRPVNFLFKRGIVQRELKLSSDDKKNEISREIVIRAISLKRIETSETCDSCKSMALFQEEYKRDQKRIVSELNEIRKLIVQRLP